MTLVEIECAANQLPRPELQQLVARLQARVQTDEPQAPSSSMERQRAVAVWLEELQRIGRRIEAKATGGPSMVDLLNEGRNRCS